MKTEEHNGRYILVDKKVIPCVDLRWWAFWVEANWRKDMIVEATQVSGVLVSTIFTAFDYNVFRNGPPILFETAVHSVKTRKALRDDGYFERYSTYDEAMKGHEKVVALVRSRL